MLTIDRNELIKKKGDVLIDIDQLLNIEFSEIDEIINTIVTILLDHFDSEREIDV